MKKPASSSGGELPIQAALSMIYKVSLIHCMFWMVIMPQDGAVCNKLHFLQLSLLMKLLSINGKKNQPRTFKKLTELLEIPSRLTICIKEMTLYGYKAKKNIRLHSRNIPAFE